MNKEEIKQELIKRVSQLIKTPVAETNKLNEMFNRSKRMGTVTSSVTDIINQIIADKNLTLDKSQETELIEYLQPTIIDLIDKSFKE